MVEEDVGHSWGRRRGRGDILRDVRLELRHHRRTRPLSTAHRTGKHVTARRLPGYGREDRRSTAAAPSTPDEYRPPVPNAPPEVEPKDLLPVKYKDRTTTDLNVTVTAESSNDVEFKLAE